MNGQKFVTAGAFEDHSDIPMAVTNLTQPHIDPVLQSDAEEADTRIWLHIAHSAEVRKLIVSPDTDVYYIGLSLHDNTTQNIIVQISSLSAKEQRYLDLNKLVDAFKRDPDLIQIKADKITTVMQTLYACTGCDYIFFQELEKHTSSKYSLKMLP